VIYETTAICKRIGRFLVFCARRKNEGGYADMLMQGWSILHQQNEQANSL